MNVKDLRGKSPAELDKELEGLYQEQFNLRMQLATGQLANNAQVRRVRRDIARVMTVKTEKTRAHS